MKFSAKKPKNGTGKSPKAGFLPVFGIGVKLLILTLKY
jgi:hypothetical protein